MPAKLEDEARTECPEALKNKGFRNGIEKRKRSGRIRPDVFWG